MLGNMTGGGRSGTASSLEAGRECDGVRRLRVQERDGAADARERVERATARKRVRARVVLAVLAMRIRKRTRTRGHI